MRWSLSIVVLALLSGGPAWSAEYYIANNDPVADDTGPGSAEQPWHTLTRAAEIAVAGDTVIVRGGVYREAVAFKNSGTGPNAMIHLQAAPGEVVTITALDPVSGWEKLGDGFYCKREWESDSQMVLVDGIVPLVQIGPHPLVPVFAPQVGEGLEDMFPGSFLYDKESKTLYVYMPAQRPAEWHRVEAAARDFCLGVGEWTHVQGIRCVGGNRTRVGMEGTFTASHHCVIEDCVVLWADSCGLATGSAEDVTVRRSKFNYCGMVGITMMGRDILLEDCETSYNNWRHTNPGQHSGGMKNVLCQNMVVRRHVAMDNWGAGLWFDIDCRDIVIEECLAVDNIVGIQYEISLPQTIIRNNVCIGNALGIWSSTSSGVTIDHNTCVGGDEGLRLHVDDRADGNVGLRRNVVTRNLCAANRLCALMLPPDGPFASENSSDHNLFFSPSASAHFKPRFTPGVAGLAAWREMSGQDLHSVEADPRFADQRAGYLLPAEEYRSYGASPRVLEWAAAQIQARHR